MSDSASKSRAGRTNQRGIPEFFSSDSCPHLDGKAATFFEPLISHVACTPYLLPGLPTIQDSHTVHFEPVKFRGPYIHINALRRMLTRTRRYLTAVRAFILAPSICVSRASISTSHLTIPILPWTIPASRRSLKRYYSKPVVDPQTISPNNDSPPSPLPYALRAAAQAFEKQVQRGEPDFLPELYTRLRQIAIDVGYFGLKLSDDHTLPRVLQLPGIVLQDAMTLLVTSPRREHADLHLTMFNDLGTIFPVPVNVDLDPPLEFTAKAFQRHLDDRKSDTLPHIYDHLCYLAEAAPSQLYAYASDPNRWRVVLWMRSLAKIPHKEHINLLRRLLHDLPRFFNTQPTLVNHQYVIKGFLAADMPGDAWSWLQQMERHAPSSVQDAGVLSWWDRLRSFTSSADSNSQPRITPRLNNVWVKPRSAEYDILLAYFARRGEVVSARMLLAYMSNMGPNTTPTERSWNIFLLAVLIDPKSSIVRVKEAIDEIKQAGHSVRLGVVGGIYGRGPVQKWVRKEILDVLLGAETQTIDQRNVVHDVSDQSGKVNDVSRTVHPVVDGILSADAKPIQDMSIAVPKPSGNGGDALQRRSKKAIDTGSTLNLSLPGSMKSPSIRKGSQETLTKAPTRYPHKHDKVITPPPQTVQVADTRSTRKERTRQKRFRPTSSDVISSYEVPRETREACSSVATTSSDIVANFLEANRRKPNKPPTAIPSPVQDGYLSELYDPELLESSVVDGFLDLLPRSRRIYDPKSGTNVENLDAASSPSSGQSLLEVASSLPKSQASISEETPVYKSEVHTTKLISEVPPNGNTKVESQDAGSPVHESLEKTEAAEDSDFLKEFIPASPSRIHGEEFGLAKSAPRVNLENESSVTLEGNTTSITAQPTQDLSAEQEHNNSRCNDRSLDGDDIPGIGNDFDNPILRKVRKEIFSAIQRGDVREASKHYGELTTMARPDFKVADALIKALCWGMLQAPPRPRILQALRIYNDLVEGEREEVGRAKGFFDGVAPARSEKENAYARIYNILLRALSAPVPTRTATRDSGPEVQEQYTNHAMGLLSDMKARGLRPDNRTVSSILLLWFRSAKDHEEAFRCYKSFLTELEEAATSFSITNRGSESQRSRSIAPPILDLAGYRAVLNAFGKLSFPTAPVVPAPLWFSIAKDMRARGHLVTVRDYTMFLGGILAQKTSPLALRRAALGIPSPEGEEDRMKAMYASVKHVHEQLTLDPTISPDASLLNTLMNAYQHLGAFEETLKVFNTSWLSGRMDHVTPTIIFDACGHAKRPREASVIWCMLIDKGWRFNKRTLDTWVECLCRLGNVEAACKFVCMYMGRDKAGYLSAEETRPDVQTCLILLKLSWAAGQNLEVKERIRSHLPHIWNKLSTHYT